ncbi:LysR family transcriptional regulator [Paracoccus aminophilus]|uniref:Transcriptional regulator, LysR family n=1 Tax=Paracoccus aminophilus JCM 7686 TaxID=1367847 RepID=S5YAT3_PARAH|nr:LysR family transcriptional regulator [Paracoccus aminophilus]AGT08528.1 transcriptional regulator, LysR family [Paracoccus aminophilus JCM 7686]
MADLRNRWDELDPMLDHFGDVLAFVRLADTASFTQAAEKLDLTRSAVGKCITRLETTVATRLIRRTTRSITLTEEGRLFEGHALRILCEVDDAEVTLAERNQSPKGCLIPVLQELTREEAPICAVYPIRRHVSSKVRRFIAMIPEAWPGQAPWDADGHAPATGAIGLMAQA